MDKYKAIDLFCGAGGLTLGLINAGFKVISGVENSEPAISTYKSNYSDHKLYAEDIRELKPEKVMNDLGLRVGELDLLAGCPPCQGFSTHRTRNKVASVSDVRNDLVFELMKFVRAMLPKTIMMENVPGLAKDKRIDTVLEELKKLGYQIDENTVQVKDASEYGVPQRRRRMILLASRIGFIKPAKKADKKVTVRDVIHGFGAVGKSGDVLHDLRAKRTKRIEEMIKLVPKDGGSRAQLPKEYWLKCHLKSPKSYTDVYGRMAWDTVSPTITGGCHQPSKGRFLHPEENRVISLREAALLQTFPKDYQFSMKKGKDAVALMIGNALPPEFIKRHAAMVRRHLEETN
ncbi:MAG: cytosine methyltransferase [Cycloclasticus sp. symbiont of Poecilosclerida sp. N]|nr:MAG: cytosine methyltransferase [Cycloclasticus sp. symbiont of Poecilosclerida sp. N]